MTTTAPRKTKRPNNAIDALRSKLFELDVAQRDPDRIASLLDWAARSYPQEHIPYQFILMGIRGWTKAPQVNSKEVLLLRQRMSRVKQILMRDYGRTVVSLPGVGPRATVDDQDIGEIALPKAGQDLVRAANRFQGVRGLVDPKKLHAGPAGDRIRKWLQGDVTQAMRVLNTDFLDKLLPPAPPTPAEEPR